LCGGEEPPFKGIVQISLEWLRRWLPGLRAGAEEIAEALPTLGIEVEQMKFCGVPQNFLVVGEVESFVQHPQADRLRLCRVRTAPGEVRQIVCGATNFSAGDRVPVALPGCILPNGTEIQRTELRGQISDGMLCSGRELHLSADGAGILLLPESWPVGTPLRDVFPTGDTVFEISLTANRGDCMGHLGIARELAAYFNVTLSLDPYCPSEPSFPVDEGAAPLLQKLSLENDNCDRLIAWSVRDVRIGQSPERLRRDLENIGLRSINNVVDITNWVMMDCGQPLHAFDAKKIRGLELHVRRAREGESILALNHRTYSLTADMLLLADRERPLVIAGTMGSVDAEVDNDTVDIVLECAAFSSASIQWTSRKLGLSTDASQRFARGTDLWAMEFCARRAVKMLVEICGGRACAAPQIAGELPNFSGTAISVSGDFIRKKLGAAVEDEEIESVLRRLHFNPEARPGGWSIAVPPFRRRDVCTALDLVEEVVRLHGVDKLKTEPPLFRPEGRRDSGGYTFQSNAAERLIGGGFSECYNYSTVSGAAIARYFENEAGVLRLANPLSAEQTHLRPSLLPGLLETLDENLRNGNSCGRFFEIGRVWLPAEGELCELLSVAWMEAADAAAGDWRPRRNPDFFSMKILARQVARLAGLVLPDGQFSPISGCPLWQDGHGARLGHPKNSGYDLHLGQLRLKTTGALGIPYAIFAGELRLHPSIFERREVIPEFVPFSNFPRVIRSVAVTAKKYIAAEQVRSSVEKCICRALPAGVFIDVVRIVDVYEGSSVGDDWKSIAVDFALFRNDGTLAEEECSSIFSAILESLEVAGDLTLRR
jgi:phenylalanyl-tRNA synthetase beta chain